MGTATESGSDAKWNGVLGKILWWASVVYCLVRCGTVVWGYVPRCTSGAAAAAAQLPPKRAAIVPGVPLVQVLYKLRARVVIWVVKT